MQPIECFNGAEVEIFASIVENFGDPKQRSKTHVRKENIPYILRFWNTNKQKLFQIFQNQLILEKEITFKANQEELEEQMHQLRRNSKFCNDYWNWLLVTLRGEPQPIRTALRTLIMNSLVNNIYQGNTVFIEGFKLQKGMKALKALQFLNDRFIQSKHFEEFRLEHSRVLNQKQIKGTLCLSIHPLDYITMSDNNYDWDTCTSWMIPSSKCRDGVIEMMNSSCVVVAYIKGEKPFYEWTDKKWRTLFIVHDNLISAIKSYPYENQEITKECLNWLRNLVEENSENRYFPAIYPITSG